MTSTKNTNTTDHARQDERPRNKTLRHDNNDETNTLHIREECEDLNAARSDSVLPTNDKRRRTRTTLTTANDNDDDNDEDDHGSDDNGNDNNTSNNDNNDDGSTASSSSASSASSVSLTFWEEFWQGWHHHRMAIAVALLATAAYALQQQQQQRQQQQLHSSLGAMAPTLWMPSYPQQRQGRQLWKAHDHLHAYQRTANVSFCGLLRPPSPELAVMDFHVPKSLIPVLRLHYVADAWAELRQEEQVLDGDSGAMVDHDGDDDLDFYRSILLMDLPDEDQDDKDRLFLDDLDRVMPEHECMRQQAMASSRNYIKGVTFYYAQPSLEQMYPAYSDTRELSVMSLVKSNHPASKRNGGLQPAVLTFTGFAAKFVNLSPDPVLLMWDGRNGRGKLVGEISPFEALGTATRPGQSFSVAPVYDSSHALERWLVTTDDPIQYYRPKTLNVTRLSLEHRRLHDMQLLDMEFAKHYLIQSGRPWLAHFPRPFPVHPMWDAIYFGQPHTVRVPDMAIAGSSTIIPARTLRMTVESVTPRVLSVENFLLLSECQALLDLAHVEGFHQSTVYSGTAVQHQRDDQTRSSSNTWLSRDRAELMDVIYERAAHVLQMDPALLQAPKDDHVHAHAHALAESLQVIRYQQNQTYTAHHDFVYPSIRHRHQPTRFATLLMYLNDDFEGGETVFPRAVTTQYHDGIKIQPAVGKAILFYNMLPDGNVDDLSQHSSEPVVSGTKYAANLWIWDPMIN